MSACRSLLLGTSTIRVLCSYTDCCAILRAHILYIEKKLCASVRLGMFTSKFKKDIFPTSVLHEEEIWRNGCQPDFLQNPAYLLLCCSHPIKPFLSRMPCKKHECRYEQFYKIEDFDWMRLKEMDANSASKNSRVERSWTETAYGEEKLFWTRV